MRLVLTSNLYTSLTNIKKLMITDPLINVLKAILADMCLIKMHTV